jgi:hypothetical protein
MDLKQSIRNWVQETALKILTTPYMCSHTVSDGEDVDLTSPASYVSLAQWLDCKVEQIIRMRGDLSSAEDEKTFCPYDAVERVFPVLYSMKDNRQFLQPFADELMDIIKEYSS